MKWLVIWAKNARMGSVELNETNLNTLQAGFVMSLIQRDSTGTEHWEVVAVRRKN